MESRSRRPHGIHSRKISVSVSEDDLAVLTARARRFHRDNISAVIHEMVATLRREEAMDDLLAALGGDALTDEDLAGLRRELAVDPRRRTRRSKRRVA